MVDRNTDEPLKIALLSGGSSAEREISLQSGAAVSDALSGSGHRVTGIDPRETDPAGVDWTAFDVAFIALHGTFGEDSESLMRRESRLPAVPPGLHGWRFRNPLRRNGCRSFRSRRRRRS